MSKVFYQKKMIGEVLGDVFYKRVKGSVHKHRAFDAWGIDLATAKKLQNEGVSLVRIEDTETGEVFEAPLFFILEKGFTREFGHGWQVFLPVKYWVQRNPNQKNLF